jgi:hypothetical protein
MLPSIRALKYLIIPNMASAAYLEVINAAPADVNQDRAEWPGVRIMMKTAAARALVSTSMGQGVAWFLINHKELLAIRQ